MSIDEKGLARLEKLSFDAYDVLINAVEKYRVRSAGRSDLQDAEKQGVLQEKRDTDVRSCAGQTQADD